MDGTLVDSTAGVQGAWEVFKEKYPHIDIHDILSCKKRSPVAAFPSGSNESASIAAHGVRTVENLKKYCGVGDPAEQEVCLNQFSTNVSL